MPSAELTEAEKKIALSLGFDLKVVAQVKAVTGAPFWAYNDPHDPLDPESYLSPASFVPKTFIGLKRGYQKRIANLQKILARSPRARAPLQKAIGELQSAYDKLPKETTTAIKWRMADIQPGMLFEIEPWYQYQAQLGEPMARLGYGFIRLEAAGRSESFATMDGARKLQQSPGWEHSRLNDFSKRPEIMNPVWQEKNLVNGDFAGDEEILSNGDGTCTIHKHRPFVVSKMVEVILLYKRKSVSKAPAHKFDVVREEGTCGQEDESTNDAILAQLKKWDAEYGVDVLNATVDSIDLKFKNLPADTTTLARQLMKICPDLDYRDGPAGLKQLGADLRSKNGKLQLWWD